MTRPKVDPAKRQRTANACDSCKRRKQKCDGEQPCSTCARKQFSCTYKENSNHGGMSSPEMSTHKRARTDRGPLGELDSPVDSYSAKQNETGSESWRPASNTPSIGDAAGAMNFSQSPRILRLGTKAPSDNVSSSGGEEEVDNHTMTRMLDDGTGRMMYIGDSATLSFLQLLRMIVETVAGPTPFSLDPGRHTLIETQLSLPLDIPLTHLLPPKETALILVDSFFVNLVGLVQVFDQKSFLATVDQVYSDPLKMDRVFLCHFNLVLAIGYCLATPDVPSHEATIIDDLRSKFPDHSEIFYFNAKSISNHTAGFEDGEVWTVQALLLMAVYMLIRSKRNVAFSYLGMAVRTAYSLGMHREETFVIFSEHEQETRKMIWRTLFTIDRFLASFLGRPVAIAEEECSGESLNPQANAFAKTAQLKPHQVCTAGLEACVRSCHAIGIILRKVYLQRRVSTKLAQELAAVCRKWPESLSPALHWRQASRKNKTQAIAILHANLTYCHSIVLLSRPFFLYLLSSDVQRTHLGSDQGRQRPQTRMKKFSDACIIASRHSVALVQNAYDGQYLPKMDSFASYSLFAAALIIFANEWARPSSDVLTQQCIANSIAILSYCGEMDPQAKHSAHILTEFRNAIHRRGKQAASQLAPTPAFHNSLQASLSAQSPFMPTPRTDSSPLPPLPGVSLAPSPALIPAATAPFAPSNLAHPELPSEDSFSGFLDLNQTVLSSLSEDNDGNENIDFDALWNQLASNTPMESDMSGGGDVSGASLFDQP